jgi:opacity protein-like surface antigen
MFRKIIILSGMMLSSSVLAETASAITGTGQFVLGLSAGPTWETGNKKQTINLEPDVAKTYTANDDSNTFPSAELFIGWQNLWATRLIDQPLISQLGISIAGAGNARLSGDIWEDADPDFNNYNYDYKINHTHVAVKGRLIGNSCLSFEPYISGSVGVGFNHAYDFSIKPKIVEEVAAPPFTSNTTTTFTYTLGVGLQKSFSPQLQAAIGYEFADWGKTQLSRGVGQTSNQGLSLSHLYAHQLQVSLFYNV